MLQSNKTILVNKPLGCPSRAQTIDVVINKSFKSTVKNAFKEQFKRHLHENLNDYVDGKLIISDRKVLTPKWVGNTRESIYLSKGMVIPSFKKCGIRKNANRSKDSQINIRELRLCNACTRGRDSFRNITT